MGALKAFKEAEREYINIRGNGENCKQCGQYYNKNIKIEEAPMLPIHYNCKCVAVPIIDNAMDETTDTKTVYKDETAKRRGTEMGEFQGEGGKKRRRKPRSKYADTAYKSDRIDEVAELVLNDANKKSIRQNKEHGGLIYCKDGVYYATPPIPGEATTFAPIDALRYIPEGVKIVGDYHTHGDYSIGLKDGSIKRTSDKNRDDFFGDEFSSADIRISRIAIGNIPEHRSYLGTPSGEFRVYYKEADSFKNEVLEVRR